VPQLTEDVHLIDKLLLLFVFHLTIVHLLPDHKTARFHLLDQGDLPKGTYKGIFVSWGYLPVPRSSLTSS
jgi:hypothetical protein